MRFYSALLHLYPASFRGEYGGDMRAILAARLRETQGTRALLILWLDAIAEVVLHAVAVHWTFCGRISATPAERWRGHDLKRFVEAQEPDYERALSEKMTALAARQVSRHSPAT